MENLVKDTINFQQLQKEHEHQNNPFAQLEQMEITEKHVKNIENTKHLFQKLFIHSHMTLFCSEAGVGKTTLLNFCCTEMVQRGYKVAYINVDASASDMKYYFAHADKHGYKLINPDMTGHGIEKVIEWLKAVGNGKADYGKTVVILDTLKKFTSVMDKRLIVEFNKILRKCTLKGMSIICASHTNKFKDEDGNPIYEGTSDLRNDFDELIYLIQQKHADGSSDVLCTANTDKGGKSRGVVQDTTFHITKEREVFLNKVTVEIPKIITFPKKEPVKYFGEVEKDI